MATRIDIGFDTPWFVGATRRFTIAVTDEDGNPKTLTGSSVASWRMTDIAPAEGTPTVIIEKTPGSGVTINGAETTIEVDEADTANVTPRDYYHEFRVTDGVGDTDTTTYGYARLAGSAFVT